MPLMPRMVDGSFFPQKCGKRRVFALFAQIVWKERWYWWF